MAFDPNQADLLEIESEHGETETADDPRTDGTPATAMADVDPTQIDDIAPCGRANLVSADGSEREKARWQELFNRSSILRDSATAAQLIDVWVEHGVTVDNAGTFTRLVKQSESYM